MACSLRWQQKQKIESFTTFFKEKLQKFKSNIKEIIKEKMLCGGMNNYVQQEFMTLNDQFEHGLKQS